MIFYKCLDCGKIFPELETTCSIKKEYHEEVDASETLCTCCCPNCSSEDLKEVDECTICGKGFDGDDAYFCPDCEKKAFTFENMLNYSKQLPECNFEEVKVNPLVKFCMSSSDINSILLEKTAEILRTEKECNISPCYSFVRGLRDAGTANLLEFVSADYSDYADWYKENYGEDNK